MAKPPKPDDPIGDSADVLRDVKVLYENFRRNCEATVAQTHAVSDAIDIHLADTHKVASVYLVPRDAVLEKYYELVKERCIANCRVWAGCIGKICKDRNVPYHILTLGNEYSTNDPHTVIAIFNKSTNKYEIVDINNDLEVNRESPAHMSYDRYMKTQKVHAQKITFGFGDHWDEDGAYAPLDLSSLNLGTFKLKHTVCFIKSDAPAGVTIGFPFHTIDRK